VHPPDHLDRVVVPAGFEAIRFAGIRLDLAKAQSQLIPIIGYHNNLPVGDTDQLARVGRLRVSAGLLINLLRERAVAFLDLSRTRHVMSSILKMPLLFTSGYTMLAPDDRHGSSKFFANRPPHNAR